MTRIRKQKFNPAILAISSSVRHSSARCDPLILPRPSPHEEGKKSRVLLIPSPSPLAPPYEDHGSIIDPSLSHLTPRRKDQSLSPAVLTLTLTIVCALVTPTTSPSSSSLGHGRTSLKHHVHDTRYVVSSLPPLLGSGERAGTARPMAAFVPGTSADGQDIPLRH